MYNNRKSQGTVKFDYEEPRPVWVDVLEVGIGLFFGAAVILATAGIVYFAVNLW